MYAYSMAAAHLHLPHAQYNHFMVSNYRMDEEGWAWIDRLSEEEICLPANDPVLVDKPLPIFLHYCQYYGLGDFILSKFKIVPSEVFTCPKTHRDAKNRIGTISPSSPLHDLLQVDIFSQYLKSNNINHFLVPLQSGVGRRKPRKFEVVSIDGKERKRLAFLLCTLQRNMREAVHHFQEIMCPST
jgi:hypothetical protein